MAGGRLEEDGEGHVGVAGHLQCPISGHQHRNVIAAAIDHHGADPVRSVESRHKGSIAQSNDDSRSRLVPTKIARHWTTDELRLRILQTETACPWLTGQPALSDGRMGQPMSPSHAVNRAVDHCIEHHVTTGSVESRHHEVSAVQCEDDSRSELVPTETICHWLTSEARSEILPTETGWPWLSGEPAFKISRMEQPEDSSHAANRDINMSLSQFDLHEVDSAEYVKAVPDVEQPSGSDLIHLELFPPIQESIQGWLGIFVRTRDDYDADVTRIVNLRD
jgi:hypothetical protein